MLAALATVGATCDEDPPTPPRAGPTGSASPTPSTRSDGGAFYTFLKEPQSIDPGSAVDAEDLQVVSQVFDSLTAVTDELEVVPAAARSWEANAEATVFTFRLRRDATFHDGSPVDAASFVRAWKRIIEPERGQTPSAALYLLEAVRGFESGQLNGVEAVNAQTLRVSLSYPFADLPAVVSHPALAPVPSSAVADEEAFAARPIGNGPFELAGDWDPEQYVRLQAFDGYRGPPPELDQVVFKIYPGDSAERDGFTDFADGELDVSPVPEGREAAAEAEYGASEDGATGPGVLRGTKLITAFYGFNTRIAPFDDPVVRRALSLLIDRDAIADEVLGGARVPARSVVPPGLAGYESPACEFCEYDPEGALELLGDRDIGQIELFIYDAPDHEAVAERVKRDVDTALGEDTLVVRSLSQADWLDAIRTNEARMFLSGWLAEYPSPDTFLFPLFSPSELGTDNLSQYEDPRVDDLLNRARRELDDDARRDLYRQAEAIVLTDMPIAPLFFYRHARVVSDRVQGYTLTPMGDVDLSSVSLRQGP